MTKIYLKQKTEYFGSSNPNWRGGKIKVNCLFCGKEVFVQQKEIRHGNGKYCSHRCYSEHKKILIISNNNPNWKGGITSLWQSIRELP